MKIGIITFHFAHNQGAVLQCYALQSFLSKMGHEVYVINYRPDYLTVKYVGIKNPFAMAKNNLSRSHGKSFCKKAYHAFRGFAKAILLTMSGKDFVQDKAFSAFLSSNINETEKYNSINSLRKNPPAFDIYISGSDQLWNPDLLVGKLDPAYFLDFGNDTIRRITFAVSLKESYSIEEKTQIIKYCRKLDAVSTREICKDLDGEVEYTVCIDPTLLLKASDYKEIESKNTADKPYVFVYGFETTPDLLECVEVVSRELGLSVINGSPDRIKLDCNAVCDRDFSPDKFLSYIKNADYVVTNSFHGTAFSIIYNKQFSTIPHTTRGKRMNELLEKLGLTSRIWSGPNSAWKQKTDYASAESILNKLRTEAYDYLQENLNVKLEK